MKQPGFRNLPIDFESVDGQHGTLAKELIYESAAGHIFVVPVGTSTDGASVPECLWNILPPFGSYWPAAILHDWAYRVSNMPKPFCDRLLLEAMESLGVGWCKRNTIYWGVRLFGRMSFDEDRASKR